MHGDLHLVCSLHEVLRVEGFVRTQRDAPGSALLLLFEHQQRGLAFGRRRHVLRALLLQVLFSARSERQLVEQIDYNLLFRWFVGLGMDEAVWNPS